MMDHIRQGSLDKMECLQVTVSGESRVQLPVAQLKIIQVQSVSAVRSPLHSGTKNLNLSKDLKNGEPMVTQSALGQSLLSAEGTISPPGS